MYTVKLDLPSEYSDRQILVYLSVADDRLEELIPGILSVL